jgi:HK97 family phage prohead protease
MSATNGSGLERRVVPAGEAEMRLQGSSGDARLVGYAAVFDSRSVEIPDGSGSFVEEIAPGAFEQVMSNPDRDVRALFNHDVNRVLGREGSGTLNLSVDDRGLRYDVDLPDTPTGNEVAALAQRGDLEGSSFTFKIAPGGEQLDRRDGTPVRRVTDIEFVRDVGPGTFPAYDDSDVQVAERTVEAVASMTRPVSGVDHESRTQKVRERGRRLLKHHPPEERRLALHEAAHAVVAHLVGRATTGLELEHVRGNVVGGSGKLVGDEKPDPAVFLAGSAADMRAFDWSVSDAERVDRDDWASAVECVDRVGWENPARQLPGHMERARKLVDENWSTIQDLARRLLAKGRMEGRELRRFLHREAA